MDKMKIYFAGAIRGGRDKAEDYKVIVDFIEEYAKVLDKHVANPNLSAQGESISSEEIYASDINWINEADMVIAEVTNPSLGVGYEISYAERLGKKILCLCENSVRLSAMIDGNPNIEVIKYANINDLKEIIKEKIN